MAITLEEVLQLAINLLQRAEKAEQTLEALRAEYAGLQAQLAHDHEGSHADAAEPPPPTGA